MFILIIIMGPGMKLWIMACSDSKMMDVTVTGGGKRRRVGSDDRDTQAGSFVPHGPAAP